MKKTNLKFSEGDEIRFTSNYLKGIEINRKVEKIESGSMALSNARSNSKLSWVYFNSSNNTKFEYNGWLIFIDKKDDNKKNRDLIKHVIENNLFSIIPFCAYKKKKG